MHHRSHPRLESPIEEQFWHAWQQRASHILLETQYPACGGAYRLDFAHVPSRIAIELDGFTHHSSHARFTQDRKRNRALQRDGWRVLTFSGSEIFHHVNQCVDEVRTTIEQVYPAAVLTRDAMPSAGVTWPAVLLPTLTSPPRRQRGLFLSVLFSMVALCVLGGVVANMSPTTLPWQVAGHVPITTRTPWQLPMPTAKPRVSPPQANTLGSLPPPTIALPAALRSAVVTAPKLNIRRDPHSEAPIVVTIPLNTGVTIHQEREITPGVVWVQVSTMYQGQIVSGWANAGYLR